VLEDTQIQVTAHAQVGPHARPHYRRVSYLLDALLHPRHPQTVLFRLRGAESVNKSDHVARLLQLALQSGYLRNMGSNVPAFIQTTVHVQRAHQGTVTMTRSAIELIISGIENNNK